MASAVSIDLISSAVADAAAGADVERVYLFGSYARGDAHGLSDVDICVDAGPTFSLFSAGKLAAAVEAATGKSVDVVSERSLFPSARESMLKDRVLVYERA